jgi:hypothetical protein
MREVVAAMRDLTEVRKTVLTRNVRDEGEDDRSDQLSKAARATCSPSEKPRVNMGIFDHQSRLVQTTKVVAL